MIHTYFPLLLLKFYSEFLNLVAGVIFTTMTCLNDRLEKGGDTCMHLKDFDFGLCSHFVMDQSG